jgi:hypothetical protein
VADIDDFRGQADQEELVVGALLPALLALPVGDERLQRRRAVSIW